MLIDWMLEGVGAGVRVWFAAVAVLGLGMMLFGGGDED